MFDTKISKRQAAADQIDCAIDHFFSQSIACAVTLAGAAEGSMPKPMNEKDYILGLARKNGPAKFGVREKEIISKVNCVRDWLKHGKPDEPTKCIAQDDAMYMILRAYTKFTSQYGDEAASTQMLEFEDWVRANRPEIIRRRSAD